MMRFLKEAELFSSENCLNYIGRISQFHRIQGSRELYDAVRMIKGELDNMGVESTLYEETYDGSSTYGTLQSPIAWELVSAEVEVEGGKRITSQVTPLVAMAHSPSGEADGEVLPILREEDWKEAEGKVVLVGKDWRNAYRRANEAGARGFIAYRKGTGRYVPYIGLFLTGEDLEWASIPAVAIPEVTAEELMSKKRRVSIRVESEIKRREVLPVLHARIGEPPFVTFTAHICHPKPGANDNASGSAMLMELARILKAMHGKQSRFGFSFLWIPEYYGTQAFTGKYMRPEEHYAVINLDMVAGSPDRSGSTLMAVRTPLSRFSMVSGLLERFLEAANSRGRSLSGEPMPLIPQRAYSYEMGSDHDVFNFHGVPGVMAITWPDRFYHSSGDTIEKVSLDTIGVIGRGVTATALFLAFADEGELEGFAKAYSMAYLGELGMERKVEVAGRLVMDGLARDSRFMGFEGGQELNGEGWLRWRERGIINERLIERRKPELAREFRKLTEDRGITVHLHEAVMLGEKVGKEDTFRALEEEFGSVEREKVERLLEIAEAAGLVELS
ncbi:MAG: DUF4910 domain-containing protein [Thermococci archaeon]|nr:DUF4910 domain-containing protein [Thermococci archaeon]